jgi:hypothetical protein
LPIGLLASLNAFGLRDGEADEATFAAETALREVVNDGPDHGIVRRRVTMLKGLLAPVAVGAGTTVSGESAALAKTVTKA